MVSDLKYHVFRYVRAHGNRVPREDLEKKYKLPAGYLDDFAKTLNDGPELKIFGGVVQLTPDGIEYVDQYNRGRWFPVMTAIVGSAVGSVVGAAIGYFLRLL